MAFFDPPPPPREPSPEIEHRPPEWMSSPSNWLGGPVELMVVLGTSPAALVAAVDFHAYPTGVRFNLLVRTPRASRSSGRSVMHALHGGPEGGKADEGLRFGVKTAQGSAFNYTDWPHDLMVEMSGHGLEPTPPTPPVLISTGGSGGGGEYRQQHWLWPLPPPGSFEMACEWRAMDIPENVVSVDGDRIRAAAAHAIEIWPDDETGESGSDTTWVHLPRP